MRNPFYLLTEKDLVYVCVLSLALLFLSFIFVIRVEPTEMPEVQNRFYGYPLALLKARSHSTMWFVHEAEVLWQDLIIDFIFYLVLSFVLVYAAIILREKVF